MCLSELNCHLINSQERHCPPNGCHSHLAIGSLKAGISRKLRKHSQCPTASRLVGQGTWMICWRCWCAIRWTVHYSNVHGHPWWQPPNWDEKRMSRVLCGTKGISSHGLQPHDPLMPGSLFVVSSVAECVWDSLAWPMPPAKSQKICSICFCLLMHLLLHCITVHTPKEFLLTLFTNIHKHACMSRLKFRLNLQQSPADRAASSWLGTFFRDIKGLKLSETIRAAGMVGTCWNPCSTWRWIQDPNSSPRRRLWLSRHTAAHRSHSPHPSYGSFDCLLSPSGPMSEGSAKETTSTMAVCLGCRILSGRFMDGDTCIHWQFTHIQLPTKQPKS